MEEHKISRRQGLVALGATAGAVLLGAGLAGVAKAAPSKSATSAAGALYTLTVTNDSPIDVDVCVYQDPRLDIEGVMPLAWLVKHSFPTGRVAFNWTTDYSFVWGETGVLKPGDTFRAAEVWPADPGVNGVSTRFKAGNQIWLSNPTGRQPRFTSTPVKGAQAGTLYIAEAPNIPLRSASVGLSMSESSAYVIQSWPNRIAAFAPHASYYLAAGNYQQGQVLDVRAIKNSVAIEFGPGEFRKNAVLTKNGTWIVN